MAREVRVGNTEIHHAAVRVRDLEAAVRFYTEVVGFKVRSVNGDPNRPDAVFVPGLQLVRSEGFDTSNKGVLFHIGISVANLDDILANLADAGIGLLNDRGEPGQVNDLTRPGGPRVRTAFFRDLEGNMVELVERGS